MIDTLLVYIRVGISFEKPSMISHIIPYALELDTSKKIFSFYYFLGVILTGIFTSAIFYWVISSLDEMGAILAGIANFLFLSIPLGYFYRKISEKRGQV